MRDDGLTDEEGVVADALVEAWNNFVKLERTHTKELIEFNSAIHTCQYLMCMRVMRRDYPEAYPTYKKVLDKY